jgi:hypothetical protein
MSGAGPQLAFVQPSCAMDGRSPLAHLLHTLNQPLTGLQCSIELALAGRRPAEHYVRTLSEGLELVSRMRVLVEARRELADLQMPTANERVVILLDNLLREAARELQPVAVSSNVRLSVLNSAPLPVRADSGPVTGLVFRTIECAISLSRPGSEVRIEGTSAQNAASVTIPWTPGSAPQHSPLSRPELGLLVARAAWEYLGGKCTEARTGDRQSWTIRIPVVESMRQNSTSEGERQ